MAVTLGTASLRSGGTGPRGAAVPSATRASGLSADTAGVFRAGGFDSGFRAGTLTAGGFDSGFRAGTLTAGGFDSGFCAGTLTAGGFDSGFFAGTVAAGGFDADRVGAGRFGSGSMNSGRIVVAGTLFAGVPGISRGGRPPIPELGFGVLDAFTTGAFVAAGGFDSGLVRFDSGFVAGTLTAGAGSLGAPFDSGFFAGTLRTAGAVAPVPAV
jgi:hypothetical protein